MGSSIDIINFLPYLGALFAGGAGVVLLAQLIKRVFGLNSDHMIHLMVVGVSAVMSVTQYLLTSKNLPPEVLGLTAPTIYGFSQGLYKEATYLKDVLSKVQISFGPDPKQAPADAAVAAVSVPADIAPIAPSEPVAPATSEFSA